MLELARPFLKRRIAGQSKTNHVDPEPLDFRTLDHREAEIYRALYADGIDIHHQQLATPRRFTEPVSLDRIPVASQEPIEPLEALLGELDGFARDASRKILDLAQHRIEQRPRSRHPDTSHAREPELRRGGRCYDQRQNCG